MVEKMKEDKGRQGKALALYFLRGLAQRASIEKPSIYRSLELPPGK